MAKASKPQSVTIVGGRNIAPPPPKQPTTKPPKQPEPEPEKTPEAEAPPKPSE